MKEPKCSELIAMKSMKSYAKRLLPTDTEVQEWFSITIDNDSASSAIYKFRLWLNDRLK